MSIRYTRPEATALYERFSADLSGRNLPPADVLASIVSENLFPYTNAMFSRLSREDVLEILSPEAEGEAGAEKSPVTETPPAAPVAEIRSPKTALSAASSDSAIRRANKATLAVFLGGADIRNTPKDVLVEKAIARRDELRAEEGRIEADRVEAEKRADAERIAREERIAEAEAEKAAPEVVAEIRAEKAAPNRRPYLSPERVELRSELAAGRDEIVAPLDIPEVAALAPLPTFDTVLADLAELRDELRNLNAELAPAPAPVLAPFDPARLSDSELERFLSGRVTEETTRAYLARNGFAPMSTVSAIRAALRESDRRAEKRETAAAPAPLPEFGASSAAEYDRRSRAAASGRPESEILAADIDKARRESAAILAREQEARRASRTAAAAPVVAPTAAETPKQPIALPNVPAAVPSDPTNGKQGSADAPAFDPSRGAIAEGHKRAKERRDRFATYELALSDALAEVYRERNGANKPKRKKAAPAREIVAPADADGFREVYPVGGYLGTDADGFDVYSDDSGDDYPYLATEPAPLAVRPIPSDRVECPRCLGVGRLSAYEHVENGVCFSCRGAGYVRSAATPKDERKAERAERKAKNVESAARYFLRIGDGKNVPDSLVCLRYSRDKAGRHIVSTEKEGRPLYTTTFAPDAIDLARNAFESGHDRLVADGYRPLPSA